MEKVSEALEELKQQIVKKDKIIAALMMRVEKSMESGSNAFSLFENNILLTKQIRDRTKELENLTEDLSRERLELKDKTDQLHFSHQFNEGIIHSLIDPLFVFGLDGNINYVNDQALETIGLKTRSEILGRNINSFLFTSVVGKNDDFTSSLEERISGKRETVFEVSLKTTNEEYIPCQISLAPMKTPNVKTKGIVCLLRNLTEIKAMEEQIENERARSMNAAKLASLGEMAGGIAHEINNPLTIIGNNVMLLKRLSETAKLDPEKTLGIAKTIDETVWRITKIISGLRTVSRDSDGEDRVVTSLRSIFETVLSLSSEKFKNSGVDLQVDLKADEFKTLVMVDQVQLSQVFINLIGNAYDAIATLEEKWINLSIENSTDDSIIKITDSGNGIPKEALEKIFNPFFTTKGVGEGTGLGLSISKSIIQKHGGELNVDLKSPHTCFVIKLPIYKNK